MTSLCIAGVTVAGLTASGLRRPWRRRQLRMPPFEAAAAPWIIFAGLTLALELAALGGHPRRSHPTISSYIGSLTGHELGKAVLFAVWLVAGWWIWGPARSPRAGGEAEQR